MEIKRWNRESPEYFEMANEILTFLPALDLSEADILYIQPTLVDHALKNGMKVFIMFKTDKDMISKGKKLKDLIILLGGKVYPSDKTLWSWFWFSL